MPGIESLVQCLHSSKITCSGRRKLKMVKEWKWFETTVLKETLQEAFMGCLYKISSFHPDWNTTWLPQAILVSDMLISFETTRPIKINWQEASMGGTIQSFIVSSWSEYKHYYYRQFLFLLDWILKNYLPWYHKAKWNQILYQIYGRFCTKCPCFVPI